MAYYRSSASPTCLPIPRRLTEATVGYTYAGLFAATDVAQIPSFGDFGASEAALVFNPGGFEAGGASAGLYANKWMPSVSDTVTKVVKNHTLRPASSMSGFAMPSRPTTTPMATCSSVLAATTSDLRKRVCRHDDRKHDELQRSQFQPPQRYFLQHAGVLRPGFVEGYEETDSRIRPAHDPLHALDRSTRASGIRSSTRRCTIPACAPSPNFLRFRMAREGQVGSNRLGFPTRALFYQPRFGAAYDMFGTGNTVLRGGWGRFYYHSGQFTNGLDASAGVATQANLSPNNWVGGAGCPTNPSGGSPLFAKYLSCINVAASPASPCRSRFQG